MNEKWEICTIHFGYKKVKKMRFSPTGGEINDNYEPGDIEKEIRSLLEDGWEPYAAASDSSVSVYHFRRIVKKDNQ